MIGRLCSFNIVWSNGLLSFHPYVDNVVNLPLYQVPIMELSQNLLLTTCTSFNTQSESIAVSSVVITLRPGRQLFFRSSPNHDLKPVLLGYGDDLSRDDPAFGFPALYPAISQQRFRSSFAYIPAPHRWMFISSPTLQLWSFSDFILSFQTDWNLAGTFYRKEILHLEVWSRYSGAVARVCSFRLP